MMDLTKIDQPFGTLDIETKLALHRAFYEGKVIECIYHSQGKWRMTNCSKWLPDYVYRLQPEPLRDIICPWSALDDQWQHAARDEDGQVWVYTEKPEAANGYWVVSAGECHRIDGILVGIDPGNKPWDESLISRPEGV